MVQDCKEVFDCYLYFSTNSEFPLSFPVVLKDIFAGNGEVGGVMLSKCSVRFSKVQKECSSSKYHFVKEDRIINLSDCEGSICSYSSRTPL
jgi:hypothetical protein